MTDEYQPTGHEQDYTERVQRGEAIANAHAKFIEARSKDLVLFNNGIDGSYQYVLSDHKKIGADVVHRFDKISLRPMRGARIQPSGIHRLTIEAPIRRWDEAGQYAQDLYRINAMAQQIPGERILERSQEELLIPSETMIIELFGQGGKTARVLLGPDEIMPLEDDSDLQYMGSSGPAGQEYRALPTLDLNERMAEMDSWFNVVDLRNAISMFEPYMPGEQADSGSAA